MIYSKNGDQIGGEFILSSLVIINKKRRSVHSKYIALKSHNQAGYRQ